MEHVLQSVTTNNTPLTNTLHNTPIYSNNVYINEGKNKKKLSRTSYTNYTIVRRECINVDAKQMLSTNQM